MDDDISWLWNVWGLYLNYTSRSIKSNMTLIVTSTIILHTFKKEKENLLIMIQCLGNFYRKIYFNIRDIKMWKKCVS